MTPKRFYDWQTAGVPDDVMRMVDCLERADLAISDLRIIEGNLPRRAISLVLEWAFLHREELADNWRLAERREDLERIKPLD